MARTKAFNPDQALEKALNIFWDKGYEATSLQDLLTGMNLSRSSLYDTFGDKRSLFMQALTYYQQRETARMQHKFQEATSAKELFHILFQDIVQQSATDQQMRGCFITNTAVELAPHDAEVATFAQANAVAIRRIFSQALHQGQENGEIALTHSPTTLAHYLFTAIQGLRVMAKTNPDPTLLQNSVNVTLSVL